MKRSKFTLPGIILLWLFLWPPLTGMCQSESHDFITYDTTWNLGANQHWNMRISRPRNMFTPGNPDTASRPVLLTMPGSGQFGTTDTTQLVAYGPHYWLNNGWDGSITLGNGKHYPILITLTYVDATYTIPPYFHNILLAVLNTYHIKRNSVHIGGFSMGAFTAGSEITYETAPYDEAGMKLVTSLVALEGQPNPPYNSWDRRDTAYKVWAAKYHGRYFTLEGSGSDNFRDTWHEADAMNDTVPGSAYFSYENLGGGAHCCWNDMWNPSNTNWTCVGTLGPNNAPSEVGTNTMGNYQAPCNIFTWMLKQGDTSMVNAGPPPPPPLVIKSVVVAEYRTWYIRSDSTIWAFNNGSLHPVQCSIGGLKTIGGSGGFNYFRMLDTAGYLWTSQPVNVNPSPNSATRTDTDTTGAPFSGNWYVNAYGNAFATIRADSSVWYGGKDVFSMFYSGGNLNTQTGTTMAPTQLSPSGMKFKKVLMANHRIIGLTTGGDVYVWTAGGSRTPTKMTIPRPAIDIFMSSLDFQGCIIPDATGSQTMGYPYVWGGATSIYGGSTAFTQPTSIKSLWNMTVPIREIAVDHNTIHYIDSAGKLWGTGFNSMGEVGNGQEFVNKYYYPGYPGYGWTFTDYENPTGLPVQISSKTDWKHLYSNNWFGFYKCASDNNDSIYSWGRNKALVLGNGLENFEEATSPDALDVLVPTMVHPLQATYQLYDFNRPTLSAGTNQAISTPNTTLTATGNSALLIARTHPAANGIDTAGYSWVSYAWSQVSGPSTASISSPTARSTTVTGLVNGTYVFRVLATDNNTGQDTASLRVTVTLPPLSASPSSITGLNGTAGTAGTPQTVTVTFSGITVTANAPTNTEISKDSGVTYASSQTLTSGSPVGLMIRTTAAAPAGAISGNLTLTGSDTSAITIPVTGTVSSAATTPDSARFQFLITPSLLVPGWQGVLGDPSVSVLSGTIPGTTITYSTVSTNSSNWGQFLGACIGPNDGVTNATIPDPSNSGVMREAVNTANLYQTTYPQFISGGWKTDGTTYDIEISGTSQYPVSAVGTYNVRGSILYSPLAIEGASNTSSKMTWTSLSPDSSGNFTFYVGKNSSGEMVGMLSYIKIKKHGTGLLNTPANQAGGAAINSWNPEKNPVAILYPNPTTGQLRVSFTSPLEGARIVLLNAGGGILQQRIQSGGQVEMDISSLPAGVYILRVQQGTNVFMYKVVKQ